MTSKELEIVKERIPNCSYGKSLTVIKNLKATVLVQSLEGLPQFIQRNKVERIILFKHSDADLVVKNHLLYGDDGSYFANKNYHEIDSIQMRKALAD